MASINASTMHVVKKPKAKPKVSSSSSKTTKSGSGKTKKSKSGVAPKMVARELGTEESRERLLGMDDSAQQVFMDRLFIEACGEKTMVPGGSPHAASTTADRIAAAADVGVFVKTLSSSGGTVRKCMKTYGLLAKLEAVLDPDAVSYRTDPNAKASNKMRPVASAVSLASLVSAESIESASVTTAGSRGGKAAPPAAREGGLLVLRALAETVGVAAEAYTMPLLKCALDEAGSSVGSVRTAAEDTAVALVARASALAVEPLLGPTIFAALRSTEWRTKACALDRLAQMATAPSSSKHPDKRDKVGRMLPRIVPIVTTMVWDTKPQVTKAATDCLYAVCPTNGNPDVRPAVPAVVRAICNPTTETRAAVDELMATTFVATVDAGTLAILCPILSRGLKDKLAIHKRAACLVINNMSKLVETPEAVAPFGPLLVPELKKVAENVQFGEIRDGALTALATLTRALGHGSVEEAYSAIMQEEAARVDEERRRIEEEKVEEERAEALRKEKEEEERKLFKEAMEAQRLLDKIQAEEEQAKRQEAKLQKELDKTKTKNAKGVCQGCGLKKCKKTCLFAQ